MNNLCHFHNSSHYFSNTTSKNKCVMIHLLHHLPNKNMNALSLMTSQFCIIYTIRYVSGHGYLVLMLPRNHLKVFSRFDQ